jgi:2-C-methyl-D-erythritol 4-phosphate cytidylyltransferase
VVLVHDAARCLAPPALIASVAAAVRAGHVAVVPAVPVTDTVRSLDGGPVDRSRLRSVQTPQGFSRDVLVAAHASADDDDATDDASLVERLGVPVHLVDGDRLAFKVTTALDLKLVAAALEEAS